MFFLVRCTDDVGYQLFLAVAFVHQYQGVLNSRVRAEGCFDLSRLNAEAAQFDLMVGSAAEFQGAVGAPACQIAGAIHAASGVGIVRIRHKSFSSEVGQIVVTARQSGSRGVELAGNAYWHEIQGLIQDIDGSAVNRRAYGDGFVETVVPWNLITAGEGGVFRGTVTIDHGAARMSLLYLAHMLRRKHVPAGKQLLNPTQCGENAVGYLVEEACGHPQRVHLICYDPVPDFFERWSSREHDRQGASVKQGTPEFKGSRVKAEWC